MNIIFLLIAFSLLLAGVFLYAFFWSVGDGQFDDEFTPSVRMLFDNHLEQSEPSTDKEQTKT